MSYQQQSDDGPAIRADDQGPHVEQTSGAGKDLLDADLDLLDLRFGSSSQVGLRQGGQSRPAPTIAQPSYFPSSGLIPSDMPYGQDPYQAQAWWSQDTMMSANTPYNPVNPTHPDNSTGNVASRGAMVSQWSNVPATTGQSTALAPTRIYPAVPAGTSQYSAGSASASVPIDALSKFDEETRSKLKELDPDESSANKRYIFSGPGSIKITLGEPNGVYSFYMTPLLTIDVQGSEFEAKGLFRTRVYNEGIDEEKGREMTLDEIRDSQDVQDNLKYVNGKLKMNKGEEKSARKGLLEEASQSWEARLRSCAEMTWAEGWNVSCGTGGVWKNALLLG